MKTIDLKRKSLFQLLFFCNSMKSFSQLAGVLITGALSTLVLSNQNEKAYFNESLTNSAPLLQLNTLSDTSSVDRTSLTFETNATEIISQFLRSTSTPPMPEGIVDMAQTALKTTDVKDSFFMKIMEGSLLPHAVIHDSKILVAMRAHTATHKQSRHFHAGLLALYEMLEIDSAALQPENIGQFVRSLNRADLLRQDCLEMYRDAPNGIPDLSDLPSVLAYKKHLTETANDPVRLLAHHYVHLAGVLAGGQKLKVHLRSIHPANELTHYEFGSVTHTQNTLYQFIQIVNSVPLLYPERKDAFIQETGKAFTLSAAVYYELYLPEEP